jgi:hypothetical protein
VLRVATSYSPSLSNRAANCNVAFVIVVEVTGILKCRGVCSAVHHVIVVDFCPTFIRLSSDFRLIFVQHSFDFRLMFVGLLFDIHRTFVRRTSVRWIFIHGFYPWLLSRNFHPPTSIHKCLSIEVRPSSFIPVEALYFSNCMYYVHTYLISYSSNRI